MPTCLVRAIEASPDGQPVPAMPDDAWAALPVAIAAHDAALAEFTRPDQIAEMLAMLRLVQRRSGEQSRMTEREVQAVVEMFVDDLAEFPPDVIRDAIRAHRRASPWWPEPAMLRDRCREIVEPHQRRLATLRRIEWHERRRRERVDRDRQGTPMTPEQEAELARILGELTGARAA